MKSLGFIPNASLLIGIANYFLNFGLIVMSPYALLTPGMSMSIPPVGDIFEFYMTLPVTLFGS